MNRRDFILLILLGMVLCSCQPDFNELTDSDQRSVHFCVLTDTLFKDILYYDGNNYFFKQQDHSLDAHKALRMSACCYNQQDSLCASSVEIIDWQPNMIYQCTIRHLHKTDVYHVVFIADVVEYEKTMGYFETWFTLGSQNYERCYLFSSDRNEDLKANSLYIAETDIVPDNQTDTVILAPMTYNGYLVFNNTVGIDYINSVVQYSDRIYLKYLQRDELMNHYYELYPSDSEYIPLTLSYATDTIKIQISTIAATKKDTVVWTMWNHEHKPFVFTINANNLHKADVDFY